MKKALLIAAIAVGCVAGSPVSAQVLINDAPSLNSSNAEIKFEKDVHDFGKLKQHQEAVYLFKFQNSGKEPLIISDAKGSCDCTVPDWPKQPIRPGETAFIKVKYDTKKIGPISKTVTISSNARNAPVTELKIEGVVEATTVTGKATTAKPAAAKTTPAKAAPSKAPVKKPAAPTTTPAKPAAGASK